MATKKTSAIKVKIQDAPTEGNFTKAEVQAAINAVKKSTVTKKNIDPGRPVSRPMAPVAKDTGWGKTLTKAELLGLVDRIYKKQEEDKMSKLSDTLAKALAKKHGKTHVDGSDANATVEKKIKGKPTAGPGKKPPTRSAGRGR
jgi:hypothetical protein